MRDVYRITNSSGLTGQWWDIDYNSQGDAASALRLAMGWDDICLSDEFCDGSYEDGGMWVEKDAVCAYETQEECNADGEGAYAPRITRWSRRRV
jgi:hypothetical protein